MPKIKVEINLAGGHFRAGRVKVRKRGNIRIIGYDSDEEVFIHPTRGIEFTLESVNPEKFLSFVNGCFFTHPVTFPVEEFRFYDTCRSEGWSQLVLWKEPEKERYGIVVPLLLDCLGRARVHEPKPTVSYTADNLYEFALPEKGRKQTDIQVRIFPGTLLKMKERDACFLHGTGHDPYKLVEECFTTYRRMMAIGKKRPPQYMDYLGWCTWETFKGGVSADGMREFLNVFRNEGFPLGWIQMDAGWQPCVNRRLTGFEADSKKFPMGLKRFISDLRREYGFKYFGIWTVLQGYWNAVADGLSPHLEKKYEAEQTNDGGFTGGRFPLKQYGRFWDDYHRFLSECGVDFIKFDAINMLEEGFSFRRPLGEVYRHAIRSWEETVDRNFGPGKAIACGGQSLETLGNLKTISVIRNSDDFCPGRPERLRHKSHIIQNIYNSLWMGQLGIPDFDAFRSRHETGELHPILRAISGGLVHFEDKPGRTDFDILRKFVDAKGRLLKAQRTALPTRDCLFADPVRKTVLVKAFNFYKDTGIIGAFNPSHNRKVRGFVSAQNVEGIKGKEFLIWAHRKRKAYTVKKDTKIGIELKPFGAELFIVTPIKNGIAVVGAVDKYISPAAVVKTQIRAGELNIDIRCGEEFVLYCKRKIKEVLINNKKVLFEHKGEILTIRKFRS